VGVYGAFRPPTDCDGKANQLGGLRIEGAGIP
jgi:hypothetical protein